MPETVIFADGKRVALASSAKRDELEDAARIGDVIDTETSSDNAKKSKPHPDIFEAAMKRLSDIRPADHWPAVRRLARGGAAAGRLRRALPGPCGSAETL